MPAVELTRLRAKINGLIERFADPAGFRIALRDLLELYANRAYRPGQAVQPQPLLPSYRVTPLILHQLELELGKTCQEQPEQALGVIEVLWGDPYLEPRLLATALLGTIPASHQAAAIQLLRAMALPTENFRMLDSLFRNGTISLRRSAPLALFQLFEEWLNSSQADTQSMGVRALLPMIEDQAFENLPPIFRLLGQLVQRSPAALFTDLQAVIEALARRTPTETAYFLRQTLSMAPSPGITRLIRRCLPQFDPTQQASLRAALQAASNS